MANLILNITKKGPFAWDKLSMREKAAFIKIGVANGLRGIDSIRQVYNEFAEGGEKPRPITAQEEADAGVVITPDYQYNQYLNTLPLNQRMTPNDEFDSFRNNYELVTDPDRPNYFMYRPKKTFGDGGKKQQWRQQHQAQWYSFLKEKGVSDADAQRLSGFFTAQDGLESAGGQSSAARQKNNYGGMQRGGKNISYDSVHDYMEDKWRMMNNRFKPALSAQSIDEYATILGNPDTAGKGYLYYVTDKVKYDPKSSNWRAALTLHMNNYINGMRAWAGLPQRSFERTAAVYQLAPIELPYSTRVSRESRVPIFPTNEVVIPPEWQHLVTPLGEPHIPEQAILEQIGLLIPEILLSMAEEPIARQETIEKTLPDTIITPLPAYKNLDPVKLLSQLQDLTVPYTVPEIPVPITATERLQQLSRGQENMLQKSLEDDILRNARLDIVDNDKLSKDVNWLRFYRSMNTNATGGHLYDGETEPTQQMNRGWFDFSTDNVFPSYSYNADTKPIQQDSSSLQPIKTFKATLPEIIVTRNTEPSTWFGVQPNTVVTMAKPEKKKQKPYFVSSRTGQLTAGDAMKGIDAAVGPVLHWMQPSQYVGAFRDAIEGRNPLTSMLRGNSGIVSEEYAAEHPWISTALNLGTDLVTPLGVMKGKPYVQKAIDKATNTWNYRGLNVNNTPQGLLPEGSLVAAGTPIEPRTVSPWIEELPIEEGRYYRQVRPDALESYKANGVVSQFNQYGNNPTRYEVPMFTKGKPSLYRADTNGYGDIWIVSKPDANLEWESVKGAAVSPKYKGEFNKAPTSEFEFYQYDPARGYIKLDEELNLPKGIRFSETPHIDYLNGLSEQQQIEYLTQNGLNDQWLWTLKNNPDHLESALRSAPIPNNIPEIPTENVAYSITPSYDYSMRGFDSKHFNVFRNFDPSKPIELKNTPTNIIAKPNNDFTFNNFIDADKRFKFIPPSRYVDYDIDKLSVEEMERIFGPDGAFHKQMYEIAKAHNFEGKYAEIAQKAKDKLNNLFPISKTDPDVALGIERSKRLYSIPEYRDRFKKFGTLGDTFVDDALDRLANVKLQGIDGSLTGDGMEAAGKTIVSNINRRAPLIVIKNTDSKNTLQNIVQHEGGHASHGTEVLQPQWMKYHNEKIKPKLKPRYQDAEKLDEKTAKIVGYQNKLDEIVTRSKTAVEYADRIRKPGENLNDALDRVYEIASRPNASINGDIKDLVWYFDKETLLNFWKNFVGGYAAPITVGSGTLGTLYGTSNTNKPANYDAFGGPLNANIYDGTTETTQQMNSWIANYNSTPISTQSSYAPNGRYSLITANHTLPEVVITGKDRSKSTLGGIWDAIKDTNLAYLDNPSVMTAAGHTAKISETHAPTKEERKLADNLGVIGLAGATSLAAPTVLSSLAPGSSFWMNPITKMVVPATGASEGFNALANFVGGYNSWGEGVGDAVHTLTGWNPYNSGWFGQFAMESTNPAFFMNPTRITNAVGRVGNAVESVPSMVREGADKLGFFIEKPGTYTRGIGMTDAGLRDAIETGVFRGNPRGTELTAKQFTKGWEKNRDHFRDIMNDTGIKGIASKYQSRTLSEKEFNAIKEASKKYTMPRMKNNDGSIEIVEISADPLYEYPDYSSYKAAINNTIDEVEKMPYRIASGEVSVNTELTPTIDGIPHGKPIEERFGPNSDYVGDGQPMSYWYDDGRNPITRGHSYAKSNYGVRVNNPEYYQPFMHELHLHPSFFRTPRLNDPNVEVFKRGLFGITRRVNKEKLLQQMQTPKSLLSEEPLIARGTPEITADIRYARDPSSYQAPYVNNGRQGLSTIDFTDFDTMVERMNSTVEYTGTNPFKDRKMTGFRKWALDNGASPEDILRVEKEFSGNNWAKLRREFTLTENPLEHSAYIPKEDKVRMNLTETDFNQSYPHEVEHRLFYRLFGEDGRNSVSAKEISDAFAANSPITEAVDEFGEYYYFKNNYEELINRFTQIKNALGVKALRALTSDELKEAYRLFKNGSKKFALGTKQNLEDFFDSIKSWKAAAKLSGKALTGAGAVYTGAKISNEE